MLSSAEYIRESLELNLFFLRIMKEHLIFAMSALTPKNYNLIKPATELKNSIEALLADTVNAANGVISREALASGQFVTPYTLRAEQVTQNYTGIPINTGITQAETQLMAARMVSVAPALEARVNSINQRAMMLTNQTIQMKTRMRNEVLSCRMFTQLYPLLLDHVLREAIHYMEHLQALQRREKVDKTRELFEDEMFWNDIMGEHSKFIRGMLDPTEDELINTANNFAREFDALVEEVEEAMGKIAMLPALTSESYRATVRLRDFKAQGTQGLLGCKIRAIILPLLADHVLREANHFLVALGMH